MRCSEGYCASGTSHLMSCVNKCETACSICGGANILQSTMGSSTVYISTSIYFHYQLFKIKSKFKALLAFDEGLSYIVNIELFTIDTSINVLFSPVDFLLLIVSWKIQ
jgi:hypothetical protein